MRLISAIRVLAAVFVLYAASQAHAQDPQPESSSKPATPPDDMKPKSTGKQKKDSATTAKPGYAIPFRFLAEAQKKKGIKSYQRYLDLYPHAEDGDKVRKKIDKLYKEVEKEKARQKE